MRKLFFMILTLGAIAGCSTNLQSESPVFKRLLIKEAQETAATLFGETFDRTDCRIISGRILQSKVDEWGIARAKMPTIVQQVLLDPDTVAVYVTKMMSIDGKTYSNAQRMMLTWETSKWGGGGYWVSSPGALSPKTRMMDPPPIVLGEGDSGWDFPPLGGGGGGGLESPCPGGKGFCTNCTGCSGKNGNTYSTCVCTQSCFCNPCRSCSGVAGSFGGGSER